MSVPAKDEEDDEVNTDPGPWTASALNRLLEQFETELRAAGLEDNTERTSIDLGTSCVGSKATTRTGER